MEECKTMIAHYSLATMSKCTTPMAGILAEPVPHGNSDLFEVPVLPGCNPVWGATGAKPTCTGATPFRNVAPLLGTDGSYIASPDQRADLVLPTTPGWQQVGCVQDTASFLNYATFLDNNLTQDRCTTACLNSGYAWAGVGHQNTVRLFSRVAITTLY
jgi:hypothetical protein